MKTVMTIIATLLISGLAHADTWRVDVIVFSDQEYWANQQEMTITPISYNDGRVIPANDSARLAAAGIRILDDNDSILSRQWSNLRNSKRFSPVKRIAWLQKNPPTRGGPALWITHGEPYATASGDLLFPLEGTLRLTLRKFLHLDADLQWTDGAMGSLEAIALREQRRMRSNTLHFFDSPRFGILAHIQKVGG